MRTPRPNGMVSIHEAAALSLHAHTYETDVAFLERHEVRVVRCITSE